MRWLGKLRIKVVLYFYKKKPAYTFCFAKSENNCYFWQNTRIFFVTVYFYVESLDF